MLSRRFTNSFLKKIFAFSLGCIFLLALLETALRLQGAFAPSSQNQPALSMQSGEFRILVLGDSVTALGGDDSWPRQLEASLKKAKPEMSFKVLNKALPAVGTDIIVQKLEQYVAEYRPSLVLSMMGVTDKRADLMRGRRQNTAPGQSTERPRLLSRFKIYHFFSQLIRNIKHKNDTPRPNRNPRKMNEVPAERLEQELAQNPKNIMVLLRLANMYRDRGEYTLAAPLLTQVIALRPGHARSYRELAQYYQSEGKKNKARDILELQVKNNPKSEDALLDLARFYRENNEIRRAETYIRRAIQLSDSTLAWTELGLLSLETGDLPKAEDALQKALKHQANAEIYYHLGKLFLQKMQLPEAEAALRNAIKLRQTRPANATFEESERNALAADAAAVDLSHLYAGQGRAKEAQAVLAEINVNPITVESHLKIRQVCENNHIPWLVIGYPNQSVVPLKRMLGTSPNIYILDNEEFFRNAIQKEKYYNLFTDTNGGNFGHATARGNALLAQRISETIQSVILRK